MLKKELDEKMKKYLLEHPISILSEDATKEDADENVRKYRLEHPISTLNEGEVKEDADYVWEVLKSIFLENIEHYVPDNNRMSFYLISVINSLFYSYGNRNSLHDCLYCIEITGRIIRYPRETMRIVAQRAMENGLVVNVILKHPTNILLRLGGLSCKEYDAIGSYEFLYFQDDA